MSCNRTSEDTKFIAFEPSEKDSKMNFELRKSNLPSLPGDERIPLKGPKEKDGDVTKVTFDKCSLICMLVHT